MRDELFFHVTGARPGARPVDGAMLRPALFARVHDLTTLRYDFPLVLVEGEGAFVETLSGVVDALLAELAPAGPAGERMRRSLRRLEREIRRALAAGEGGTLAALWERAAERVAASGGDVVRADLARARAALRLDGPLVDCDAAAAPRLVTHAWRAVQRRRTRALEHDIRALAAKAADLLRADLLRSQAGRGPDMLRASVGAPHRELFDFDAMARLLAKPSGATALPERRRRRIEEAVATLQAQHFFGEGAYDFAFDHVDVALASYRARLPELAALVRALAIAELEVQGRYADEVHDEYFRAFDQRALRPEDTALFPDYLVRLDARTNDAAARAHLVEALTSGAPLKVLLQTGDPFGVGAQLAATAMGLGDVFVLQAPSAHLYRVAPALRAALEYRGAALVSVFSGVLDGARVVPPYLVASAALESRAFPAFAYDPSAGPDWAHRFTLQGGAQLERAWPVHELAYADERLQRVVERVPFTFADVALCDPARAEHFADVPRERWNGHLVPVGEWLEGHAPDALPCVYAIDAEDRLHKLVVDERLMRSTRRCAEAWARLRELDDLKRERAAPAAPALEPPAAAEPAAPPAPAAQPASPQAAAEERPADEPYIETARCATCNECTNLNPRMFKYDANKQAYIADVSAGSFRELVEAAEACQVAIIHPGKPRDPNEPGLDELLQRAEAFR